MGKIKRRHLRENMQIEIPNENTANHTSAYDNLVTKFADGMWNYLGSEYCENDWENGYFETDRGCLQALWDDIDGAVDMTDEAQWTILVNNLDINDLDTEWIGRTTPLRAALEGFADDVVDAVKTKYGFDMNLPYEEYRRRFGKSSGDGYYSRPVPSYYVEESYRRPSRVKTERMHRSRHRL